jgi:type II secretory ATPase GspE/PulE/Tfp pilus assembly ATPase PilB-like protein
MATLDDHQMSDPNHSLYQRVLAQFSGDWVARLNVDQMFVLIDGVLPFEACLYYQVLPLFLEGNRLHLGMVSPDDTSASEYVRRIISYLNYSLVSQPITSEALRVVLTAYLNYVGNQTARRESVSYGHHRHSSRSQNRHTDPHERLTLVVDSPDNLYVEEEGAVLVSPTTPPPVAERPDEEPALVESVAQGAAPELFQTLEESKQDEQAASQSDLVQPLGARLATNGSAAADLSRDAGLAQMPSQPGEVRAPGQPLAILHVNAQHLESPTDFLASLSPPELLQELLARVLLGGIGRLYFESYPQHGRIVWSQNGVLQSVLDRLELPLFQGVIRELKTMANVSLSLLPQPQQLEMEYLYDRSSVLLRFRFMPTQHGEEATLQVLRGAALKFYQQQQINRLEKDALTIAKQLQNKLNEIRTKAYSDPSMTEARLESLPKLMELLQSMEQQLGS